MFRYDNPERKPSKAASFLFGVLLGVSAVGFLIGLGLLKAGELIGLL